MVAVLDEAGIEEHRHDLAVARLQMQILTAGVAARVRLLEQTREPRTLGERNEIPDPHADHLVAAEADGFLGDDVGVEDGAVLGTQLEDGHRCIVDRLAIAGLLFAQLLLAGFDEEIRDVQDTLLELLVPQRQQRVALVAIGVVGGAQVLRQDLAELHLPRQKARRREARNEGAPRMAA